MIASLHFLWKATHGYRFSPWRSPYLRWRIETFSGMKADDVGFRQFWGFVWRERGRLWRFLRWVEEMEAFSHHQDTKAPRKT